MVTAELAEDGGGITAVVITDPAQPPAGSLP
jgi:hypothetical protein